MNLGPDGYMFVASSNGDALLGERKGGTPGGVAPRLQFGAAGARNAGRCYSNIRMAFLAYVAFPNAGWGRRATLRTPRLAQRMGESWRHLSRMVRASAFRRSAAPGGDSLISLVLVGKRG